MERPRERAARRCAGALAPVGALLARLLRSRQAQADAAGGRSRRRSPAAQVWAARVDGVAASVLMPVVRDGDFIVAGGDGSVLALDARRRPRAVARPAPARACRPASAATAATPRWSRATTSSSCSTGGREPGASACASRVVDRAAGRRRARVRDGRGPRGAGLRRARTAAACGRCSGPASALTLAQPGVARGRSRTRCWSGQGPRLAGVDPLRGTRALGGRRWPTPRGTNEVERLADLVGPALRVGDRVCARAFQSAVGCADARARRAAVDRATPAARRRVGGDANCVVGADASDRITAWRTATGDVAWTSEQLLYRGLSGRWPSSAAPWSFGDFEGQVHFLAATTARRCCACPPTARRWSARRWCRAPRCWWSPATAGCSPSGPN
ncbi:MAG: PQQ-binding-like beta-propeller repeat protein [Comamonadaceae bacterium]|nr:PQQ-binding-like beta-propeller repeat protein [Comamonadaceae bacterium]